MTCTVFTQYTEGDQSFHLFVHEGFISLRQREWSEKKGDSAITLMSSVKLGQAPISSHRLKASLYLRIIFINFVFSLFVRAESFRSIFSNKISASDWNCLGSSFANQG